MRCSRGKSILLGTQSETRAAWLVANVEERQRFSDCWDGAPKQWPTSCEQKMVFVIFNS